MTVNVTGNLQIKRRPVGGAAGAPVSLRSGEPAFNEADQTLYIGIGDNGEGQATSVVVIGGAGAFVTKQALQDALEETGAGDMLKSRYDSDDDGTVDKADLANRVPWSGIQDLPETFPPAAHSHNTATTNADGFMSKADKSKLNGIAASANNYVHPSTDGNRHVPATTAGDTNKVLMSGASAGAVPAWQNLSRDNVGLGNVNNTADADKPVSTAQQAALDQKANLDSPELTGVPKAPTAAEGTNNQQIATTAFVLAQLEKAFGVAPEALDTFAEIAEALGNDPNFAATMTTALAGKLAKTANLSDLADAGAARNNLGLGTLAQQNANNVNITGGAISGVTMDGGTF